MGMRVLVGRGVCVCVFFCGGSSQPGGEGSNISSGNNIIVCVCGKEQVGYHDDSVDCCLYNFLRPILSTPGSEDARFGVERG